MGLEESLVGALSLVGLLQFAISKKATDLHFGGGIRPSIRIDGQLVYISQSAFTNNQTIVLVKEQLPEEKFLEFEKQKELDWAFGVPGLGRFRVNLFYQRGSVGCSIRVLPFNPVELKDIGLPMDVAQSLALKPVGLIIITGPTGSGKSTTLAALIDYINEHEARHIVTIEDPIEYMYKNKKSVIHQREVGKDTESFNNALRHVLRQDPDVVLIGEMRDLESMEIAMNVAETGHLVFTTLHTPDAVQAINRIIDVFPSHQQQQVRTQLSFVLQAVVSQQLLPRVGGGLVMVPEILIVNSAVRNLIRESKAHQVYSAIQMGQNEGMRTMNMSFAELVQSNKISREEAFMRTSDPAELQRILGQYQAVEGKKKEKR